LYYTVHIWLFFYFARHNMADLPCLHLCSQKNCYANVHCSVDVSLISGYSCAGTCSYKRPPICLLVSFSTYQIMQYQMYF